MPTTRRDLLAHASWLREGYLWSNDRLGVGIDLNEQLAAKFSIPDDPSFDTRWGELRRQDGRVTKP